VDREPEERREETRRGEARYGSPSEGSPREGAHKGQARPGNRRGQQVPPDFETSEAREPNIRQEPFPHGRSQERPQDGLERTWWRRIFRGPHEGDTERPWWRRMFGG
jgi:hypothetical protein